VAKGIEELVIADFSGGLNTRDSASELQKNEFPDSMNVTIDERGAIQKRLGYEKRYASALGSGLVSNEYFWKSRGALISQIGTGMHKDNAAAYLNWSTSARVGIAEYLGNLYMIHPVDGVKKYDGTTVTTVSTSIKGDSCASWQNRLWTNDATNVDRVNWTDIGTDTFGGTNFNSIREKDSARIVNLSGASGVDISGRPGLLVFKADSTYRIYDSTNGAYNTIDATIGTASNISTAAMYGRVYSIHPRGIYYTDGINPMIEASQKIENFFHRSRINHDRPDLYCAGRAADRFWFSVPDAAATANTISLELHPLGGWIVPHTMAASAFATVGNSSADMIFGSPTVNGRIYNSHSTGADDTANIASYFQSRWIEPDFGNKVRIRRLRMIGSGEFNAALYKNYESGQSLRTVLNEFEQPNIGIYDTSTYDSTAVYGPSQFQGISDHWSIGVVRSLSVRIDETSQLTQEGRPIIGVSTGTVGAWSLSHMSLMAIDLGNR